MISPTFRAAAREWAQVKTIAVADSTAACSFIAAVLLLRYRRSRRYRAPDMPPTDRDQPTPATPDNL